MKIDKQRRIGVLMGGISAEREVSLDTGQGVFDALVSRGYTCEAIDWKPGTSLPALLSERDIDVVWNALHGTFGEDGAVQGLLACMGIACTGSGILASALAMDKVVSKRIFESHRLRTPAWMLLERNDSALDIDLILDTWDTPFVIKPGNEGSSVGVTIVTDRRDIEAAVTLARSCRGPTMVEEYIPGTELQIGILDDVVLGSIEIQPAVEFYDYEAKYKREDTQYVIPPTLDPAVVERAEAMSLDAYGALECSGYGRVDLRVNDDGVVFLLEVNTLPGMTSHSLLPKIAAYVGMDYPSLCERILASAR